MNKVTTLYAILLLSIIGLPNTFAQHVQRVRVDFETPEGYVRHLLLGFTSDNSATDNIDYGYDAYCFDNLEYDLNWMISDNRFIIQGVGEFDVNKSYPFGMFMQNSGDIKISLNSLENFESPIDVYIYDSYNNSFQLINENSFDVNINTGDYLDRFFITFQNINAPNSDLLSINDNKLDNLIIRSVLNSKEILIDTRNNSVINKVEILDILGKKVANITNIDASKIRIPAQHINSKIIIVSVFTDYGVIRKKLLLF